MQDVPSLSRTKDPEKVSSEQMLEQIDFLSDRARRPATRFTNDSILLNREKIQKDNAKLKEAS